jgi:uncharacterized protein YjbJ (UPF0337 family)
MGDMDRARDLAKSAMGKAKERIGEATGNEELEDAGKREQLAAEAREAGRDMRDKAAGAAEDIRRKFDDDEDE